MSKIIASIDGTTISNSVCDYGAWFSQKCALPLTLLNVIEKVKIEAAHDWSGTIGIDSRKQLLSELVELESAKSKVEIKHSTLLLQAAHNYVEQQHKITADTLQKRGNLLEVVTELTDVDLLIMGKNGQKTEGQSTTIGTQIENIARAFSHPILVCAQDFTAPTSFLVAFDGSETSQQCIQKIVQSEFLQGLVCHIVYVGYPSDEIQKTLDDAKQLLSDHGWQVETHILSGDVEPTLLKYQNDHAIDLMVIGAYGHSKIRQFFIGSTTTKILSASNKPIVLIR